MIAEASQAENGQSAGRKRGIVRWIRRVMSNPVVLKELRGRMRGARAFVVLTLYLLLLGGSVSLSFIPLASLPMGTGFDLAMRQLIGKTMFGIAVFIQFIIVSFVAPGITAGTITSEREHQTYDILRTTLLSARDLVNGKLLAALSFLFLLLLAALPIQSLAFLLGGVGMEEVIIAVIMLLTTAVALSTIGIFLSSLLKRTLVSTVLAYAVSILSVIGLPLMLFMLATISAPMINYFFARGGGDDVGIVSAVIMIGLGWILVSTNPLAAAILTEVILTEEQSLWYFSIPLPSSAQVPNPPDLPVLSPWIGYVVGYLLLSLLLIKISVRIIKRPEV